MVLFHGSSDDSGTRGLFCSKLAHTSDLIISSMDFYSGILEVS